MNELKLALKKDMEKSTDKSKDNSGLKSNHNKSKSQSMWVFDDDSEQTPEESTSQKFNNSTYFLESKLTELLKKDKKISQVFFTQKKNVFERIVQEFQEAIGEGKSQVSYLLVIQDKLTDLIENMSGQKKKFFEDFVEMVEKKISQIRKKQKKNDLLEFDKIVNNNFKKKEQIPEIPQTQSSNTFLAVSGTIRHRQKSASKSREKQTKTNRTESRQKSSEKPLNKLLLREKHIRKQKYEQENENINQTHTNQNEQSVSFSAIMSASCAVKQRNRPRRSTKRKEELEMLQNNKEEDGEEDREKAFVFYRPKKNK